MDKVREFIKRELVLVIAACAAIASCFFVPPDGGYLAYIDFRTLALLYCLMTVVNGFRKAGLFDSLAQTLCRKAANVRAIGLLLVLLSFFSSMLITNDVALLTFVPFALIVLGMAGCEEAAVHIIVLQTVAANLGSMLTPVGNPQNLYLYSRYDFSFADFIKATFPVWALSLVLVALMCLLLPRKKAELTLGGTEKPDGRSLVVYAVLFAVCLLTVLRVIPWPVMLAAVVLVLLIFDRRMLLKSDFMLLLTFVAFFIFAGNLARIDAVNALLRRVLLGRVYWTGVALSQVISNVPAALLLSGFTDEAKELLLGVDIGGLGTPIASLASLISLKLYSRSKGARTGRYVIEFIAVSVVLLALLSLARRLF